MIGEHRQRFQRGPANLDIAGMRQRVANVRRGRFVQQNAGGFERGDLNLVVQVAHQKGHARCRRRIANFLERNQPFIHHRVVFRVQRFDQVRNRRASAQDADGPRRVAARLDTCAALGEPAQRRDHVRTRLHIGVDNLVVGVAKFRLDRRAHALDGAAHAALAIAGQIHVD